VTFLYLVLSLIKAAANSSLDYSRGHELFVSSDKLRYLGQVMMYHEIMMGVEDSKKWISMLIKLSTIG
jgi:hypothetical protein